MGRILASIALCTLGLCGIPTALAELPETSVLVLVEGAPVATRLRLRLAQQFGERIKSLSELADAGSEPAAVVGVRYSSGAGLAVSYLDRTGRSELLNVGATPRETVEDVAYGLVAALLSRHLPTLEGPASEDLPAQWHGEDSGEAHASLARRWLWAPKGWWLIRAAPRTGPLNWKDSGSARRALRRR